MNFKEQLIAIEREMMYARSAGNTERLRELVAQHDEITNAAWGMAYTRACELDPPNSPEFDAMRESIYEDAAMTTPRTRSYPYPVQSPSKHWFITALRRFWRWC